MADKVDVLAVLDGASRARTAVAALIAASKRALPILAAEYYRRTGDRGAYAELHDALEALEPQS